MAMCAEHTAYFDAGGRRGSSEVLFVSGFVSSEEKWKRFEQEWPGLLERHHITAPFHMSAYVGDPAYTNADGKAFFVEAIPLIKRCVFKSFSSGVVIADLVRLPEFVHLPQVERENCLPYPMCGLFSALEVVEWSKKSAKTRPHHKLEFVFEAGDRDKGGLMNLMEATMGGLPVFKNKSEMVALEPADMVAWEHQRRLKDQLKHGKSNSRLPPPRLSLEALSDQIPHSWKFYSLRYLVSRTAELGYALKSPQPSPSAAWDFSDLEYPPSGPG